MLSSFSTDGSSSRSRDGKISDVPLLVLKNKLSVAFLEAQQAGSKDSLRTFWLNRASVPVFRDRPAVCFCGAREGPA
jgi:hypothetical protein